MIEVSHLTKHFDSTAAVRDVSFVVPRGAIVGLLGPNGSGKTTVMRILTGFFPPSSGTARVAGFDATAQSLALRRTIGYLPENAVLYPEMAVRGFLNFCAAVRRMPRARRRQRIDAVMHDCGLSEVATRRIGTLSKGFRQRVGLAQALLHEPEVLVLDEPTVGLDPRQLIEMRALIRGLHGRCTVLLSTHILSEVSMTCDRVVIIDRGQVVAEDSAAGLSRRLEGTNRTLVRVAAPWDTARQALLALPGVDAVEAADMDTAAPAGMHGFVVSGAAGEAVRAAIAAAIVGHGWDLVEMRPLPLSLEDLFVRLTGAAPAERGS